MFSLPSLPFARFGQVVAIGIPSCVASYFVFFIEVSSPFMLPLPLGPKPLPLIGRILDVPMGSPWWGLHLAGQVLRYATQGPRLMNYILNIFFTGEIS